MLIYLKKTGKLITIIFLLGLIFIFSTLWYFSSDLPDYKILANYKPPVSSRVHSGDGQLIAEYAIQKRLFRLGEIFGFEYEKPLDILNNFRSRQDFDIRIPGSSQILELYENPQNLTKLLKYYKNQEMLDKLK